MRVPYVFLASLSVVLLTIFLTAPMQGFEAGYGERDWIDLEQTELPPRPTRTPPTVTPTNTPTANPTDTPTATSVPLPPRPPRPAKSSGGGQTLDLQIEQSASANLLQPAMLTTFTITTTHSDGQANAEQVLIFVELPTFLDIEQSTTTWGTLTRDENRVQVRIPILYPRDQVILQVTARVNQEPMPELMQVIASVATTSRETTYANNQAGVLLRRQ